MRAADNIDEHWDLYQSGITLLLNRIKAEDYSEFNDEERALLEDIFIKMEE